MGSQLSGNLKSLLLREVSDATHPSTEAPKRQHGALASDIGIFIQDIFRLTQEDEEVHLLISHEQAIGTDIARAEVAGHRGRGVHKDAVATVREEEGHGLILTVGLWSLRVGHTQVNLLPHLVQRCERLAAAIDPFRLVPG